MFLKTVVSITDLISTACDILYLTSLRICFVQTWFIPQIYGDHNSREILSSGTSLFIKFLACKISHPKGLRKYLAHLRCLLNTLNKSNVL